MSSICAEKGSGAGGKRSGTPAKDRIESAVRRAGSWSDLEQVCAEIGSAYQAGELEMTAAGDLAGLVASMARMLPEVEEKEIWSDALRGASNTAEERCPCCGGAAWWDKEGTLVCGICHPKPAWRMNRRRAA